MTTAALEPEPPDFAPGRTQAPTLITRTNDSRAVLVAKLTELGALQQDWDGYGAARVDPWAIVRARQVAEHALEHKLPTPRVLPLPNGGVQLEWGAGPVELELEIEPGGAAAVFVCDDEETGQQIDGALPKDGGRFDFALAHLLAMSGACWSTQPIHWPS